MNTNESDRLIMQWTEVPDGHGGTRLEARWTDPTAQPVAAHAA